MGSRVVPRRGRGLVVAASCGIAFVASCSSGGGGDGGGGGGPPASSLDPKAEYTPEDVRHFLSRTHFGVRRAEYEAVLAIGLPAYVDAMLLLPPANTTQAEADAFAELVNEDDPPGLEGMFPSTSDLARWWVSLMLHTQHPFQEELAFFWHDHFAVSSALFATQERHWIRDYVNLLRERGTGNLRSLLIDMSRNPAMARWLDQTNNDQFNINENYAREFWELFTLGVDNGYTDDDIRESSEAHTGLNVAYDPGTNLSSVAFVPEDHADGVKLILGAVVPAQHGAGEAEHDDVESVVDITLGFLGPQGGVAEYVCRRLLEHYYAPEPPQALVDGLAQILRASGWELRPVLATLFKSQAFYSDEARAGIVKNPVEASVGFMRSTGLLVSASTLDGTLTNALQRPTQPPDVDGWDKGTELLSSVAMMEMANMAADAIEARTYQESELGLDLATLLPPGPQLAGDVIDYWAQWLGVELVASERALLVQYMDTRRLSNGQIVASIFTAGDPGHLDERLRGLLYVLAQHPTFLLR